MTWPLTVLSGLLAALASNPHTGAEPAHAASLSARTATAPPVAQPEARVPQRGVLQREQRERLRPKLLGLEDPARSAEGQQWLLRMEDALGVVAGVRAAEGTDGASALSHRVLLGDVLPGLAWQALYTTMVVSDRSDPTAPLWRPHHRLPVFCRYQSNGDGYRISEFAKLVSQNPPAFQASYTREVRVRDLAWRETEGTFDRTQKAIQEAAAATLRDFVLGAFPLAVRAFGGAVATAEPSAEAEASGAQILELRYGQTWRPLDHEWISDFYLAVDKAQLRPMQLQFHVTHFDRAHLREPIQWAYADFEEWREVQLPEELRASWGQRVRALWESAHPGATLDAELLSVPAAAQFPARIVLWRPEAPQELVIEFVGHGFGALPEGAFLEPWRNQNQVFSSGERADHWDPPPKAPAPKAPTPGLDPGGTPGG